MKRILIFLMILTAAAGAILPAALGEEANRIDVDFADPGCAPVWTWAFPYSDGWFLGPDDVFSREIAKGSLGLAVSAFEPTEKQAGLEPQYETYLSGAGFEQIRAFGYDLPNGTDTFAGIIGRKQIGDFTLIAVAGRGSGYGKEWGGNLRLGDGTVHEGFALGAGILEEELDSYLRENPADGPVRLWVTGFSRSAAVGNLAAADWTASGRFDRVYGYFFACPRNTTEPARYPNLFNLCGSQDLVTQIPMQCYGYERNGIDLFLPSAENTAGFGRMKAAASETSEELTGFMLTCNPEINLVYRLAVSLLPGILPTRETYVSQVQETLISAIPEEDVSGMTEMLPGIMVSVLGISVPEEKKPYVTSMTQIGTLAALMTTLGKAEMIQAGIWDPDEDLYVNLAREHMTSTYLSWIFSTLPDGEILREAKAGRVLFLDSCDSLTVSRDGAVQWTLEDGTIRKAAEDADGFLGKFTGTATLMIPAEGEWQIEVGTKDGKLRGLEILLSPDKTFCDACVCYLCDSEREDAYEMTASGTDRFSDAGRGGFIEYSEVPCNASNIIDLITAGFEQESIKKLFSKAFGKDAGTTGTEMP